MSRGAGMALCTCPSSLLRAHGAAGRSDTATSAAGRRSLLACGGRPITAGQRLCTDSGTLQGCWAAQLWLWWSRGAPAGLVGVTHRPVRCGSGAGWRWVGDGDVAVPAVRACGEYGRRCTSGAASSCDSPADVTHAATCWWLSLSHDVADACLGEVERDAGADRAAADDEDLRCRQSETCRSQDGQRSPVNAALRDRHGDAKAPVAGRGKYAVSSCLAKTRIHGVSRIR